MEPSTLSTLSLDGTSTLHAYSVSATTFSTILQVSVPLSDGNDNEALVQAIIAGRPMTVDTIVPVAALKSGEEDLDKNMQAALKGDKHRDIAFHMDSYSAVPVQDQKDTFVVSSKGTLTIAGTLRPISLVTTVRVEHGHLLVSGAATISMLDFGVTPPKFLFGAISAAPDVVIHFTLTMKAPEPQSARK